MSDCGVCLGWSNWWLDGGCVREMWCVSCGGDERKVWWCDIRRRGEVVSVVWRDRERRRREGEGKISSGRVEKRKRRGLG